MAPDSTRNTWRRSSGPSRGYIQKVSLKALGLALPSSSESPIDTGEGSGQKEKWERELQFISLWDEENTFFVLQMKSELIVTWFLSLFIGYRLKLRYNFVGDTDAKYCSDHRR